MEEADSALKKPDDEARSAPSLGFASRIMQSIPFMQGGVAEENDGQAEESKAQDGMKESIARGPPGLVEEDLPVEDSQAVQDSMVEVRIKMLKDEVIMGALAELWDATRRLRAKR